MDNDEIKKILDEFASNETYTNIKGNSEYYKDFEDMKKRNNGKWTPIDVEVIELLAQKIYDKAKGEEILRRARLFSKIKDLFVGE
jgi:hypothetical protein